MAVATGLLAPFLGQQWTDSLILLCCAGEISAVEALRQACQSLKQVCEHMKATFQEEYREHVESTGLADAAMAD